MRFKIGILNKRHSNKKFSIHYGVFSAVASLIAAVSIAYPVWAIPMIPYQLYGTVTGAGIAAPSGISISAKIGGVEYAVTQTNATGKYGFGPFFRIPADDPTTTNKEGGVNGEEVGLYVAGILGGTGTFTSGGVINLDLSVATSLAAAAGGGGGGGGGGPAPTTPAPTTPTVPTIEVKPTGLTADVPLKVDNTGVVAAPVLLTDSTGKVALDIPQSTKMLDSTGTALKEVTCVPIPDPPPAPTESGIVFSYSLGPNGSTFNPPIYLNFKYDPATLADGVNPQDLYIAWWDGAKWVNLKGIVDTTTNTLIAEVSHFTTFAIVAKLPVSSLSAANLTVSELKINPEIASPGDKITVSVLAKNSGAAEGTFTVALKTNGVIETTKTVAVAPGSSLTVSFETNRNALGSYSVDVNGLPGTFTIKAPSVPSASPTQSSSTEANIPTQASIPSTPASGMNWWLISGIGVGIIVLGLVILTLVRQGQRNR